MRHLGPSRPWSPTPAYRPTPVWQSFAARPARARDPRPSPNRPAVMPLASTLDTPVQPKSHGRTATRMAPPAHTHTRTRLPLTLPAKGLGSCVGHVTCSSHRRAAQVQPTNSHGPAATPASDPDATSQAFGSPCPGALSRSGLPIFRRVLGDNHRPPSGVVQRHHHPSPPTAHAT